MFTGIDVDKDALELTKRKGHKIIHGSILDLDIGANNYDLIYSSHVIEHVDNPKLMMEKISNALKPGGIFVVDTPNLNSWDASLFASSGHWGGFHFPRHWTFFTRDTLGKLANDVGMQEKRIHYLPIPIHWIWSIHSIIARKYHRPKLARLIFPLIENRKNIAWSLFLKITFTIVDYIQRLFSGRTSRMEVWYTKR